MPFKSNEASIMDVIMFEHGRQLGKQESNPQQWQKLTV